MNSKIKQPEEKKKRTTNRVLLWLRHGELVRWIVLGMLVGAASGLGAAAFFYLLELAKHYTFAELAGYKIVAPAHEEIFAELASYKQVRWIFFLLPIVGGLLSGIIVYTFAPEAEGHGTDAMIDSFHNKEGRARARVPFVKAISTIITIASGGSAGREGPIAQIGSGIGVWIANLLKLSTQDRRKLLLAGTGGGLGAIFRAPLGGAITALEVLYTEDLETDALIPTVISSITAYTIFSLIYGFKPIFEIGNLVFKHPLQLIFYVILGLVCVPIGMGYIKLFYFMRDKIFRPLAIPNMFKPMIGGLGIGLLGLFLPEVYGGGWGQLQLAINGQLALEFMAILVFAKILATCFTISSGGSGGVFGPTLMIGGMIGGVVGLTAHAYFPGIVTEVDAGAFVLVGMAAFFSGVAHAPLGALLMVTEITGGYHLIAPLLLVSIIAMMLNRRLSIYNTQVKNKFASPAHIGEFTINVLEEMKVEDLYEKKEYIPTIAAGMPFSEVQHYLSYEDVDIWPVIHNDGSIIGILSLDTSRPILFEEGVGDILIAQDMAIPAAHVHPDDSLYEALLEFLKFPISEILVTDPDDENKILGLLHHRDLIRAYNNEIIERKGKD